jgi:phosphoglycerate dehydrogenase-like enzyme
MTQRPAILIYHPEVDEIWDGLRDAGIDAEFLFAATYEQALAQAARADVLVALDPEITEELVTGPRLRWIQALTSGMERVLGFPGLASDVMLTSMRGHHGPQVSELAFLLMLSGDGRQPAPSHVGTLAAATALPPNGHDRRGRRDCGRVCSALQGL